MNRDTSKSDGWWQDWPWRQVQTNLREIDMKDIDAKTYVKSLLDFDATCVMINTSGIIASYPTNIPYHYQSPYLTGDSLEEIIRECHKAGIKVTARTDFSKVRRPIYEMHPEWAYISSKGHIVDYNGDVAVCINGEYQQKYALEIIKETLTTLDVDGIFFNMGGFQVRDYSGNYYGICQCEQCRRKFEEMYNLPLPKVEDMNDPVYRKYSLFKDKIVTDQDREVSEFIQSIRPDVAIYSNLTQRSVYRQESNTAVDRALPHWQYSASDNTKFVVASYPSMISTNTTVDFIDFPYRHVAVSPYQQKLRLVQSLANGGQVDYYMMGRLDNHQDRSGHQPIKEVFRFHKENQDQFHNMAPKSQVCLLRGEDQSEYRGWFRFLVEKHFLFDSLLVSEACKVSWDDYQAVILPNIRYMSDELVKKVDSFVERGGKAVVVSGSGFFRDDYEQRGQMPFKSLGIERVNAIRDDMRSTYFMFDNKQDFPSLKETDLIYMDGSYVYADYQQQVKQCMSLIPPHMFGPPERCYYTQVTQHPGYTVNDYVSGRAVYIPWEPGKLFYRQGYTNTIEFIGDILENTLGISKVKGNLPPMVEVNLLEKRDSSSMLFSLVNTSGNFGVTFYQPVEIRDLTFSIPCQGRTPQSVTGLVSKQELDFCVEDGILTVDIPSLKLYEAVSIR